MEHQRMGLKVTGCRAGFFQPGAPLSVWPPPRCFPDYAIPVSALSFVSDSGRPGQGVATHCIAVGMKAPSWQRDMPRSHRESVGLLGARAVLSISLSLNPLLPPPTSSLPHFDFLWLLSEWTGHVGHTQVNWRLGRVQGGVVLSHQGGVYWWGADS